MKIRPGEMYCGYPMVEIRQLLRKHGLPYLLPQDFEQELGVSRTEAERIRRQLRKDGYVELRQCRRHGDTESQYFLTTKGQALVMASAARPMRRATAARLLQQFLERVEILNTDPGFLYSIEEVRVFGSFLGESNELGDLDLAISYVRRDEDNEVYEQRRRQRVEEAREGGRSFPTFFDMLAWPQEEIRLFLTARSKYISLHDLSTERELFVTAPYVVVYSENQIRTENLTALLSRPAPSRISTQ